MLPILEKAKQNIKHKMKKKKKDLFDGSKLLSKVY
jgi:hypothetical protein